MSVECNCPSIIPMPVWAQTFGYLAAIATIGFPIPQVLELRKRNFKGVSLLSWIFNVIRGMLWIPFGIGFALRGKPEDAMTMIGSNSIAAGFSLCIAIIIYTKINPKYDI